MTSGATWLAAARETRGSEIAEAAMVLPLMFMILLAIFCLGRLSHLWHDHHAARGAHARPWLRHAPLAPRARTLRRRMPRPPCRARCGRHREPTRAAMSLPKLDSARAVHVRQRELLPVQWRQPGLHVHPVDLTLRAGNVQLSFSLKGRQRDELRHVGRGGVSSASNIPTIFIYRAVPAIPSDLANMSLPAQAQMRAETQ